MKSFKTTEGCFFGEYMYDNNRNIQYKLLLTRHAILRAKERLYDMGVRLGTDEDYCDLAIASCIKTLTHTYMSKYLHNMTLNHISARVLVRDCRTNIVFVIAVKPYTHELYCVTYGSDKEKRWVTSHDTQRRCWIYDDDTMVFSTAEGNTVWSPECEQFLWS